MNDAEMTLGKISMTQPIDSYHIFLSFLYFYSIATNRRILWLSSTSFDWDACSMDVSVSAYCFAFLLQSIYLTAFICLYYC